MRERSSVKQVKEEINKEQLITQGRLIQGLRQQRESLWMGWERRVGQGRENGKERQPRKVERPSGVGRLDCREARASNGRTPQQRSESWRRG